MDVSTSYIKVTRIEDLPEDVIVHILSFLPTVDAITTTTLLPSWHDLWHRVPIFQFDILPFYISSSKPLSEARALFADCIGRAFFLLPPHIPLQHFHLLFHYADFGNRKVRSWIRSAVKRGISKLKVHFYNKSWMEGSSSRMEFDGWGPPENMHEVFDFCFSDIGNSLVMEIYLHQCGINFPSNLIGGFESLTTLVLHFVQLRHTHHIKCLVSVCVNLQTLNLEMIHNFGVDELRIHHKKIEKLKLKDHYRIDFPDAVTMDIYAPKLLSLTVDNFGVGFSSIRINVPSLVEADFDLASGYFQNSELCQSVIMSLQSVERLRLQNMSFVPWNVLATFSYLKILELLTGFSEDDLLGILGIVKASPMLEWLIIDCHNYMISWFDVDELTLSEKLNDKFLDLKIPRLRQITMKNYRNTRNELYLVDMFKTNKAILERIVAYPPKCIGEAPPYPRIVLWEAKQLTLDVERLPLQNMSCFWWNALNTFRYIKNLELLTGFSEDDVHGILCVLKESPLLESIIMDCHYYKISWFEIDESTLSEKMDDKFVDLKIPRLREITIKNYRNTMNELYLVGMIKMNKVALNKIVVVPLKRKGEPAPSSRVLWDAKQLTLAL